MRTAISYWENELSPNGTMLMTHAWQSKFPGKRLAKRELFLLAFNLQTASGL